jgi:aspartate/methionine/tyrosine aminotransferase
MSFAKALLAERHVAATPGHDFDTAEGHRTMRLSYAGTIEEISTAVDRVREWLSQRAG